MECGRTEKIVSGMRSTDDICIFLGNIEIPDNNHTDLNLIEDPGLLVFPCLGPDARAGSLAVHMEERPRHKLACTATMLSVPK